MPQKSPVKQQCCVSALIYAVSAAVSTLFMIARNSELDGRWLGIFLVWLIVCVAPLIFVFAYPHFLFLEPVSRNRLRNAAIFHGVAAIISLLAFVPFSLSSENPLRDFGDSLLYFLVPLSVLVVFLVSAFALLLKRKSHLTTLASILFWAYWLALALAFVGRWYQGSGIDGAYYFFCFIMPALLAFASGAISYSPKIAHVTAIVSVIGAPFLYRELRWDSGMGNVWVMFNQPDDRFAFYPPSAVLGICSVALLTLTITTAALRLLPARWEIRKFPVSLRTWPGFAASFLVLALWFSQSVLPYRIPGAVDYSDWPILEILHVEKRGLQFHETCVKVWARLGRPRNPDSLSFSGNDRRLFQYRFEERGASAKLSEPLIRRIETVIASSSQPRVVRATVKPIRDWNADNWYFIAEGSGLRSYTSANGFKPPQEIVDLFDDLEKLPRSSPSRSELRDVCLGFCYDPLSEMGYLFANHRCFNDGHGTVCR